MTSDLTEVDIATTTGDLTFTTVTANASAHTKGSYAELIASTSATVTMIRVTVRNTGASTVDTSQLLDIATGAAASETVVVANIPVGFLGGQQDDAAVFWFPLSIASGTRISARVQSIVAGGDTADVNVTTFSGLNRTATAIDTIGANTATSTGVSATDNAWVEMVACSSAAYTGMMWGVQLPSSSVASNTTGLLSIGTGAGGAETAIIDNIPYRTNATEVMLIAPSMPIFAFNAAASTRIAVFNNNSGTQAIAVVLFGLR